MIVLQQRITLDSVVKPTDLRIVEKDVELFMSVAFCSDLVVIRTL